MSKEPQDPGFHIFEENVGDAQQIKPHEEHKPSEEKDPENRLLLFECSDYQFAVPLLEAREVIEKTEQQRIPNTKDYFLGIANIRGEVIGILDFARLIGLPRVEDSKNKAVIIFDTEHGSLGVQINKICGVKEISKENIEPKPHIKSVIPLDYIIGVAKLDQQLITIVQLKKLLDEEEMLTLRKTMNS